MSDLRAMCDALCEGWLGDADAAELERLVTSDAEARRFYIRYAHLHTTLHRTVGGEARLPMFAGEAHRVPGAAGKAATVVSVTDAAPRSIPWRRRRAIGALAAAAVTVAAFAGYLLVWVASPSHTATSIIAVPPNGVIAAPRTLVIDSGTSEFILRNGTVFMIDGPASATVHSDRWIDLEYGLMTLTVPPDAGELIVTAGDLTIRHLGTEFTVVRDDASTEVRVIDGSVAVVRRGHGGAHVVAAGQVLRSTAGGAVVVSIPADAERIPLINADFEQVDADAPRSLPGWASFGATEADPPNVHRQWVPFVEPRGGQSVAKVFGRFDPEATFTGIYQEFGVEPGARCVGSVWMMHTAGDRLVGDNAAWCKLEFTDSAGRTLRHDEGSDRLTAASPPDQYIESRIEAVAPADAARVRFVLIFAQDDKQSPGAALFDDASLTLIPTQESPR